MPALYSQENGNRSFLSQNNRLFSVILKVDHQARVVYRAQKDVVGRLENMYLSSLALKNVIRDMNLVSFVYNFSVQCS